MTQTWKTKLIEKALPLQAINEACVREKSIRHGHPSTLHLWWARRPLAACRAVIWASLVDDPSAHPDRFPTEEAQEVERQRLFRILEQLVVWENSVNEEVLAAARKEIDKSTDGNPPPVLDPFSGGGSIPLEAHRLGLTAHASDLNPIPVLLSKAMIEIAPRYRHQPPVNPDDLARGAGSHSWSGATGLSADVAYYGRWMREEAFKRIGNLYPRASVEGGAKGNVIAWLWARSVTCPNPACSAQTPLMSSAWLSTRGDKAWAEFTFDPQTKTFSSTIRTDGEPDIDKTIGRQGATCLACRTGISLRYIREEAKAGRLGVIPKAMVIKAPGGRAYAAFDEEQLGATVVNEPRQQPSGRIDHWPGCTNVVVYGLEEYGDLFSDRQLKAMNTFAGLVASAREQVLCDATAAGVADPTEYSVAVATYLAFAVDRLADRCSTSCGWDVGRSTIRNVFGRGALPMVWEYAEVNPFSSQTGNFLSAVEWITKVIDELPAAKEGKVRHADAATSVRSTPGALISTDPPYYDNIPYAILADFF